MAVVKMSIHRALSELKTMNARINHAMEREFIKANKKSNDKIGGKSVGDYKEQLKGNFKSVITLIENQKRIKAGIVASNAVTKVIVAEKEYTVAEAIERNKLLCYEEAFLRELQNQYTKQRRQMDSENDLLPDKLEKYLQSVLGDKSQRTADDVERYTKEFETRSTYELIDPCGIEDYIHKLQDEITKFKGEVDYVLSESNAITFIEVDLAD